MVPRSGCCLSGLSGADTEDEERLLQLLTVRQRQGKLPKVTKGASGEALHPRTRGPVQPSCPPALRASLLHPSLGTEPEPETSDDRNPGTEPVVLDGRCGPPGVIDPGDPFPEKQPARGRPQSPRVEIWPLLPEENLQEAPQAAVAGDLLQPALQYGHQLHVVSLHGPPLPCSGQKAPVGSSGERARNRRLQVPSKEEAARRAPRARARRAGAGRAEGAPDLAAGAGWCSSERCKECKCFQRLDPERDPVGDSTPNKAPPDGSFSGAFFSFFLPKKP